MNDSRTVLIIEDDDSIRQIISLHLENEGFQTESTPDGEQGLQKALQRNFALVILDLQLHGMGGIEVCKRIRELKKFLPIIILTSRANEIDKVIGLEIGADDYMTKPFSVYELTARIRSRLRNASQHVLTETISKADNYLRVFGGLSIDVDRRRVTIDGNEIDLTRTEFDVLAYLSEKPGHPFTREALLESVWNVQAAGYEDTVSALIQRLRKKIEADPAIPRYVRTVRGVGYRFVEPYELESGCNGKDIEGEE